MSNPNNSIRVNSLNANNRTPHNDEDSYKYELNCQSKIDNIKQHNKSPETIDWLELEKQIPHDSEDYTLFIALLEKRKHIVVKIGPQQLIGEYNIGKILEERVNLPTFLKFYCIFHCIDDFHTLKGKKQDEKSYINSKRKSLCKKHGEKINILVMPYITGDLIYKRIWKREDFNIFKNIMIHIITSMLYAYSKIGFMHGDLHLGNVILQHTKRKSISYNDDFFDFGEVKVIGNIMPIIMDYGMSNIEMKTPEYVYNDLIRIITLMCSESNLVCNSINIVSFIKNYKSKNVQITPKTCNDICTKVNEIEIEYDKLNIPPRPAWLNAIK